MPIFACGAVIADIVECHRARGGAVEPGDGAQQRRLAATGAADDGDDLAQPDIGGKPLQRVDAVRIDFSDAIERQHQAAPLWRPNASCQRSNGAVGDLDQPVGGLAEDGEDHDRRDDLRGLAQLLAVDQEIAEPFGRAHEFGGDHEHPAQPKPDAQRNHIGRQHRRQQNAPDHRRAGEPEGAADLDDLAVDRQDRAHHAEIDREEHADRDQRDFRGFENAEPQDEQRHPGDRRDRAQRLHGGIEQLPRQAPIAGDGAEQRARDHAEAEAGEDAATASPRYGAVSSPLLCQFDNGREQF